jgi:hypothetical protein
LLSEPQLRFACCYAIVHEISKYKTNGIQKHADAAFEYWKCLRKMLARMLRPIVSLYPRHLETERFESTDDEAWTREGRFAIYPEIDSLKNRFSWFRLDPHSDSIIEAFCGLPAKIQDRLRDKKDLDEVGVCLTQLAWYLYSEIPEIPSTQGSESVIAYGDKSLVALSERLLKLASYATERKVGTNPAQFWRRTGLILHSVTVPFAHPNIFACFVSWYVLTLALTLMALRIVLHFLPSMAIDSILVSLIVGGPLACAVTAVAVSRTRKVESGASKQQGP